MSEFRSKCERVSHCFVFAYAENTEEFLFIYMVCTLCGTVEITQWDK